MSTTPAKRRFRVGEGRTLTLPNGLVEGVASTRVHARDVECRHCVTAAEAGKPAPHTDVIELEHARIAGSRSGAQPFGRFVANLVRTGDLVELNDAPAPPAVAPVAAPVAPAPAAVPATHSATPADEHAPEALSPADHARLAKETTP